MKKRELGRIAVLTGCLLYASVAAATELPLERVVLFTSGVGHFERHAEIQGAASVDLAFETGQVADVLKSLVVRDGGGGRIRAVTVDARDPVERTLQAFSLDLADNPTLGQLLNRARGVPVRIEAGAQTREGPLLGVETRKQQVREPPGTLTREFVNVMTEDGLTSIALDTVQRIEILDPAIRRDLDEALRTLAGAVARDRRTLRLAFEGEGRRPVTVHYLLETPVWKTSYRLVLDDEGGFLQGWAHVENMTDEDWAGVELTLVSGQPVSFVQNLYDPIYLRRPVVENESIAAAPAPVYDQVLEDKSDMMAMASRRAGEKREQAAFAMGAARAPRAEAIERETLEESVLVAGNAAPAGELFTYPAGRIDLPRRQSAMVPIVNRALPAHGVSIYNERTHATHPYNGVEATNDTGLFLMQGPVTVFEDGIYAGDARLGDTPRDAVRLLAYAVDLKCEVAVDRRGAPEEIVSLRIVRGALISTRKFVQETVYRIRNQRDTAREIIVQHPYRPDWEITTPAKWERAHDDVRFRLEAPAGSSTNLTVREARTDHQTLRLAGLAPNQVEFYLRQRIISPALRTALQRLIALQREQQQARAQREQLERRREEMTNEQKRIRENMRVVTRPSESYAMWERRLVEQETELMKATEEIERLRTLERTKQAEIDDYVAGLDVE